MAWKCWGFQRRTTSRNQKEIFKKYFVWNFFILSATVKIIISYQGHFCDINATRWEHDMNFTSSFYKISIKNWYTNAIQIFWKNYSIGLSKVMCSTLEGMNRVTENPFLNGNVNFDGSKNGVQTCEKIGTINLT